MLDIFIRALCFVALIVLGYVLRRIGFFKIEDFRLLSKLCLQVTLTAAIVVSFSNSRLEYGMLLLSIFGFLFGVLMMLTANFMNLRRSNEARAFAIINSSGCNIGNFVLPFARGFLGPVGVMAASLFDAGNSFICLGMAGGIGAAVRNQGARFEIKPVLQAMSHSVPLFTYMIMVIMGILDLRFPDPVLEFAEIIANANAFLAMLTIGVGFRMGGNRSQIAAMAKILLTRHGLGIAMSVLSFTLLPLPLQWRQALVILFLAPVASSAPTFTARADCDYSLACAVNSMSIVISIVTIVIALMLIM